jgi:hypothetical protein
MPFPHWRGGGEQRLDLLGCLVIFESSHSHQQLAALTHFLGPDGWGFPILALAHKAGQHDHLGQKPNA